MRDLAEFNNFMLDVVRSVEGVRETRTTLSFGGRADIDTLLELEMEVSPSSHTVAASVWIDVEPGMDRICFQNLLDLPPHPEVRRYGCSTATTAPTPTCCFAARQERGRLPA